jgi:hypothetical protein
MRAHFLIITAALSAAGCSSMGHSDGGSARASQELLLNDQKEIEQADSRYREAILKYGATSNETVAAKTALDNAKNKYVADQQRVQQLQGVNQQPDPVETTTRPAPPPAEQNDAVLGR